MGSIVSSAPKPMPPQPRFTSVRPGTTAASPGTARLRPPSSSSRAATATSAAAAAAAVRATTAPAARPGTTAAANGNALGGGARHEPLSVSSMSLSSTTSSLDAPAWSRAGGLAAMRRSAPELQSGASLMQPPAIPQDQPLLAVKYLVEMGFARDLVNGFVFGKGGSNWWQLFASRRVLPLSDLVEEMLVYTAAQTLPAPVPRTSASLNTFANQSGLKVGGDLDADEQKNVGGGNGSGGGGGAAPQQQSPSPEESKQGEQAQRSKHKKPHASKKMGSTHGKGKKHHGSTRRRRHSDAGLTAKPDEEGSDLVRSATASPRLPLNSDPSTVLRIEVRSSVDLGAGNGSLLDKVDDEDSARSKEPDREGDVCSSDDSAEDGEEQEEDDAEEEQSEGEQTSTSRSMEGTCAICFCNEVNSVVLPCGHMGLCIGCARDILRTRASCPFCRTTVKDVVQIYKC
eukprot:TRINITY_DN18333_c0_g1_i2.p1 TRINITY_DN18333_c0_g1~~TRINITY_DN18333_c0_g1_i2.p1  ORF type:complete len:496 (-),score=118.15 TRINITY_DN18333_c0_g1_i2:56-1426(-)